MDQAALERAKQRIATASASRPTPADLGAALERSREQVEALAATAAELESAIPERVGDAVRDGLRAEVLPVARHIAELRGLFNQAIRRLERIEGDLLAERKARVDDLALLVDLVSSGWRGVDTRLARLEASSSLAVAGDTESAGNGSETSAGEEPSVENGHVESLRTPDTPSQGQQAKALVERAEAA